MEGQDIRKMGTQNSKTIILKEIRPLEKKNPLTIETYCSPKDEYSLEGSDPLPQRSPVCGAPKPHEWSLDSPRLF